MKFNWVPYIVLLCIGIILGVAQEYVVTNKYPYVISTFVNYLPVYLTLMHLVLFFFFNGKKEKNSLLVMLGSAIRLFAYLVPTVVYIYLNPMKNMRMFFVILIFIYYLVFTLTDSVLKIKQQKKFKK